MDQKGLKWVKKGLTNVFWIKKTFFKKKKEKHFLLDKLALDPLRFFWSLPAMLPRYQGLCHWDRAQKNVSEHKTRKKNDALIRLL